MCLLPGGAIVCSECSATKAALPAVGIVRPVRVCDACAVRLAEHVDRGFRPVAPSAASEDGGGRASRSSTFDFGAYAEYEYDDGDEVAFDDDDEGGMLLEGDDDGELLDDEVEL